MGRLEEARAADAADGLRSLIRLLGADPDTPALRDTPRRFVAALRLLAPPADRDRLLEAALTLDPAGPWDPEEEAEGRPGGVVAAGPVAFSAVCEDHLFPFSGLVHVGYAPGSLPPPPFVPDGWRPGPPVGPRRLAAVAALRAAGLTSPERIAADVTQLLRSRLGGLGAVCLVRPARPCQGLHVPVEAAGRDRYAHWGIFRADAGLFEGFVEWTWRRPAA